MPSVVNDLAKLRDNHVILLIILLSLLSPGLGTLVVFFPQYVVSLDAFKVVFISACFSMSLSIPLLVILFLKYAQAMSANDNRLVACLTIASMVVFATSAILLTLSYYLGWEFTTYLTTSIVVNVIVNPLILLIGPYLRRSKLI